MPVTLQDQNNSIVAGYEVWTGCEGSGQLSIYNSLQLSLNPIFSAFESTFPGQVEYAVVEGFMLSLVTANNPLFLSKLEGYPFRFNLGGWRYLQANRAMGSVKYIDTFQWGDDRFMKCWVSKEGFPNVSFPGAEVPVPAIKSVLPALTPYAGGNYLVPSDGFSFFLNEGVEMSFCFQWYAQFNQYRTSNVPLGVYLLDF